jgi:hypothetical protein
VGSGLEVVGSILGVGVVVVSKQVAAMANGLAVEESERVVVVSTQAVGEIELVAEVIALA